MELHLFPISSFSPLLTAVLGKFVNLCVHWHTGKQICWHLNPIQNTEPAVLKLFCRKVPNQLQAFLGDHDWLENQEVASFRRAIQEVDLNRTTFLTTTFHLESDHRLHSDTDPPAILSGWQSPF